MSGVIKGMLLGAGGALGLCSQTESLNDVPRAVLRTALSGYDKVSVNHSPSSSNSNNQNSTSSSSGNNVNDEVKKLAMEIAQLRAAGGGSGRQVVVYGGNGGGYMVRYVVLGGSIGVAVLYYKGYGFANVMYATKSALNFAVETLEEKVALLGAKLEKAKSELLVKVSSVEGAVDSCRDSLEVKIAHQTEEIKADIGEMSGKMTAVERSQKRIELTAEKLDSHMMVLEEKFDESGSELRKANSGIALLVNSVIDLPFMKKNLAEKLKQYLTGDDSEDRDVGKPGLQQEKSRLSGLGFLAFNSKNNDKAVDDPKIWA